MVSQTEAELFTLVVNDLYGELPSRILAVLFYRGRSTLAQLSRETSIDARRTKHAICVLLQQNLLYHHTPAKGAREAFYEANHAACYNLLRVGKAVALIAEQHGAAEGDVAQSLVLTGHARIEDLEKMVLANAGRHAPGPNGVSEASMGMEEEEEEEGDLSGYDKPLSRIGSMAHLHQTLYNLLRADVLEVVGPHTFQSPEDIYRDIEDEVSRTSNIANQIKRGADRDRVIADRYREILDAPNRLKRQLDPGPNYAVKRRRLTNGSVEHSPGTNGLSNGANGLNGVNGTDGPDANEVYSLEDEDMQGPHLDSHAIIRLNFEKCLLELRNESMAKLVADAVGDVASEIFLALLRILTADVPKCATVEETVGNAGRQKKASAAEILAQLSPSVALSSGLGKAKPEDIDLASAERVRGAPDGDGEGLDDGGDNEKAEKPRMTVSLDEDSDDDNDGDGDDMQGDVITLKPHTNATPAVTFRSENYAVSTDDRVEQVRQHLLVLAESPQRFVRMCSRQGGGQWTIDVALLLQRLREAELDATIEQSYGRQSLRLTRILREKGKMEERPLMGIALLSKNDMHRRLLAMKTAGICELQEVPRDNTRLAAKTTFLWYYDADRHRRNVLSRTFKTMLHLWQRLEMQRQKCSLLLEFVARRDVRGKEAEVMIPEHYNKWKKHLEIEEKLLGQISRLEEVVSILRDY